VSKNPPLTEDQIRQSAEAEARHAAAPRRRAAPHLDYMIAQQRQLQVAAALEAIVGSGTHRQCRVADPWQPGCGDSPALSWARPAN
jgi:hypothetical protein